MAEQFPDVHILFAPSQAKLFRSAHVSLRKQLPAGTHYNKASSQGSKAGRIKQETLKRKIAIPICPEPLFRSSRTNLGNAFNDVILFFLRHLVKHGEDNRFIGRSASFR